MCRQFCNLCNHFWVRTGKILKPVKLLPAAWWWLTEWGTNYACLNCTQCFSPWHMLHVTLNKIIAIKLYCKSQPICIRPYYKPLNKAFHHGLKLKLEVKYSGLTSGENKHTLCAFKYFPKHICHKCSNTCTHIRIHRHRKTEWLISRFPSAVRSIFCASLVGLSVYPRHLCLAYQPSAMFEHVTV